MNAVELITRLRNEGILIWAEGGRLQYKAPAGKMTPDLLEQLRGCKEELLGYLRQVDTAVHNSRDCIEKLSTRENIPLSYTQESMWFIDQFVKGNPVFNIANALHLKGRLQLPVLKEAIKRAVGRHESFRTVFAAQAGIPYQKILPVVPVTIEQMELDGVEAQAGAETQAGAEVLAGALTKEAVLPFDLEGGPLFRFKLFRLAGDESVLSFVTHHIISDAWSNAIFVQEIFWAYTEAVAGRAADLPSPVIQPADYASWQKKRMNGELLENYLAYWKKKLADLPVLQLPTDYPRPKNQSYDGGYVPLHIGIEQLALIKALCVREGTSLFIFILTVFKILLFRYSGQMDIPVGTVVANRERKELEKAVGLFMNTLVLRTRFGEEDSFAGVLQKVKQTTLDAYSYQELPFDKLLEELQPERDLSRTPLFQVMFILQNSEPDHFSLPDLELSKISIHSKLSPFDLRLQLSETEDGLGGGFEFALSLFRESTIRRMAAHFRLLLAGILAAPGEKISAFPLLEESERKLILEKWNATAADYPQDRTLVDMFLSHVRRIPDQVAVYFRDKHLTYRELDRCTDRLATRLLAAGVRQDDLVAIMLERSLVMPVGILGILKSGAAYLPVDPAYPEERIAFILQDSGAKILVTREDYAGKGTKDFKGELIILGEPEQFLQTGTDLQAVEQTTPEKSFNLSAPGKLAYCIYTSGSTGRPKGTLIEHHALVNRIKWQQKHYPLGPADVLLQKTPYTFDVSVWELVWWAMEGATCVFLDPGAEKDPDELIKTIEKYKITVIHFVPSMLNVFLERLGDLDDLSVLRSLKQVFTSGEALTSSQAGLFHTYLSPLGVRLTNLYGPTEASIDVSYYDCLPKEIPVPVPIGKPIDNTQLLITDPRGGLLPVGIPGELCIAGVGLARGYLNREELTREKFIPNPFLPGGRMYRTGDLAKWREDGNIEFLGRLDFQVKIRGLRIELPEIENVLRSHPLVRECVVIAWQKDERDTILVAYIEYPPAGCPEAKEFKGFLGEKLPDYMIPNIFMFVEKLPLSPNGKIDRRALPRPVIEQKNEIVSPGNDLEEKIASIWRKELKLAAIGIHDNFFDLGGHSLMLVRVHSELKKICAQEINLMDLFSYSTIHTLAEFIASGSVPKESLLSEDRLRMQKEARMRRRQHRRENE